MTHLDGLLAWCLANIQCDACQTNGARYCRERDRFLCDKDLRMMERFAQVAKAEREQQQLPDTDGEEEEESPTV